MWIRDWARQSPSDTVAVQQDEHLDFMTVHLDGLGSLANNLGESLERHSNTLDSLDEKSESTLFKSKMVTRRSDRLIQKTVSSIGAIIVCLVTQSLHGSI